MKSPRVVLCMKWGTLYPPEYVNVLYSACRKYITGDFRFVCLTNEPEGIVSGVEVFPIPDIGLDEWHYYNGAWPKLGVFKADLYELKGRALFIDLDTVLLDNIDALFEQPGPLVAIDNDPWKERTGHPCTMSSVFAFELGSLEHVVAQLREDRDGLVKRHIIEQEYLHHAVEGIRYWPQEWLVSFKYHLRRPLLVDRFLAPSAPPKGARLLIFHGKPRPVDLARPPRGNWDRFPHYGAGAVGWMRDYWRLHGGRVN
ncbi:glycosyltransferase [Hydrogenophaga sp.]|uniref:glycosyltransferase n=1 Tax=Hydrogenophaga sp. TaxID=1904254 RepID=UPI00261CAD4D|nr:glycosyltransferase [Hydrogenophaga sp.]MDM7950132.1 glycosyltransferase [Hydrogenophaga sp.]